MSQQKTKKLPEKLERLFENLSKEELLALEEAIKLYHSEKTEIEDNDQHNLTINDLLIKQLAIEPNLKGYIYMLDALDLILEDNIYLQEITTLLYPTIAKKEATISHRVERDIRQAIGNSWENMSNKNRQTIFYEGIERKPTNKQYLAYVYYYIRNRQIEVEKDEKTFIR